MQFSECSASVSIALEKVVRTSKEQLTKQEKQKERVKTWREICLTCLAKNGLLIIIVKNLFVSLSDIIVRSLPDINPLTLMLLRSLLSLSLLLPVRWKISSHHLMMAQPNLILSSYSYQPADSHISPWYPSLLLHVKWIIISAYQHTSISDYQHISISEYQHIRISSFHLPS